MTEKNISTELKIAESKFVKEKEYWRRKLSGEFEKVFFPRDYKTFLPGESTTGVITFTFSGELFSRMTALSSDSLPNLHMVLTAALVALLAKYTGNKDITVGTAIDKQHTEEQLINKILPLRVPLTNDMTFKELLLAVRKTINEAIENQNYPIETLISQLNLTSPGDEFPLFDVSIILENIQDKKYLEHIHHGICFSFLRRPESIEAEVRYCTDWYDRKIIKRLARHFICLLEDTLFNVEIKIDEVDLVSEVDKKRLIDFNNTQKNFPMDITISELFEQQVTKTPDNIAIEEIGTHRALSFRELNNSAQRLANRLIEKGTAPGSIVGILAERSLEAIAAILGVLKARGTFLPIDTVYPAERKKYMLEDSGTTLLLAQKSLTGGLKWEGETIIIENIEHPLAYSHLSPGGNHNAASLAYILYTSGSTGKPKGVMIEHRSLLNYILWAAQNYAKNIKMNFPLFTSIAFDLTITSIFTPLVTGNAIVVYGGWEKGNLVGKIIADNNVGVIKLTPSHLNLIRYKVIKEKTSSVKRFIVGGEQLETQLAQDINENFEGNIDIYNEYGPTEATVGCMIYKFNAQKDDNQSVPIGRPSNNNRIYLLDRNRKPVPMGAVGELYITGAGVARGYLNRPESTAEKFIPNPFIEGTVMYRTGDLARWLEGDSLDIEFLGRKDHQVKIRGYRVELGEIETCLLDHEDIKEAVVTAKKNAVEADHKDEKRDISLCAYFVSHQKLNVEELRKYLFGKLPHYMLPLYFIQLEAIPLTSHGKLDLKSLPEPSELLDTEVEYQAPGNEIERFLVDIWQDVLGTDTVSIDDSFFSLGGDSINAVQIAARLQTYKFKLDLQYLYRNPTIRELANYVEPIGQVADQGAVEGDVILTPVQHWFFQQSFPEKHHFNQSFILYRQEGFQEEIIEAVFNKLVEHHDALRMVFEMENGKVRQFNRKLHQGRLPGINVFEIKETGYKKIMEEKCSQLQLKMDLNSGPLVNLGLFKTIDGDYLLISIHHLVVDGVSMRILIEDFITLFKHLEEEGPLERMELPLKTTSFKKWAERLYEYANSQQLLEELGYWKKLEEMKFSPLSANKITRASKLKDRKQVSVELSKEYTTKLLKEVNKAYNTDINDILLTTLGAALKDWTGKGRNCISMEGHGREAIMENVDVTRTIGWFTTVYPVVLDMENLDDISSMIMSTKEMLRQIPNKGFGYWVLKYMTDEENKQGLGFHSEPEISFNYLGQVDEGIDPHLFKIPNITTGNLVSQDFESPKLLEIYGIIVRGQLNISVNYNTEAFNEAQISSFARGYKKSLQQIIDHCAAREETELTLSDYGVPLDEQEAEVVFDILRDTALDS